MYELFYKRRPICVCVSVGLSSGTKPEKAKHPVQVYKPRNKTSDRFRDRLTIRLRDRLSDTGSETQAQRQAQADTGSETQAQRR